MTSHNVNTPSDLTSPVNQRSNITNSYASAASHSFPSKNQAIVFSCIDNAKLQDYLIPLGTIINPKNIIFSSRLSHNRICMYLANKTVVDNFMTQHGSIEVLGEVVTARRLVSPAERLVLSGVCPSITHQVLVEELQNIGLKVYWGFIIGFISPITFLKISSTLPEYSHILSFRRQVYISPITSPIPDSILINFDQTPYRIFLSQGTLTCFICKNTGHISSQCKTSSVTESTHIESNNEVPNQTASTSILHKLPNTQQSSSYPLSNLSISPTPTNLHDKETTNIPTHSNTFNQPHSAAIPFSQTSEAIFSNLSAPFPLDTTAENFNKTDTSPQFFETTNSVPPVLPNVIKPHHLSENSNSNCENASSSIKRSIGEIDTPPSDSAISSENLFAKPKLSKPKKPRSSKVQSTRETLENFIDNHTPPFVLNFHQLSLLIDNVQGSPDTISVVKEFTTDMAGLLHLLQSSYQYANDRSTKSKFTKLQKKLHNHLGKEISDLDSDSSVDNRSVSSNS